MKNIYKQKRQQGFTIIEVLIVLAIAALILLIVFLAVPALQRNSRNNSRNNDAARLASLVNDYVANHAGTLPAAIGNGANQLDLTSEQWAIMDPPVTANIQAVGSTTFPSDNHTVFINRGVSCNQQANTMGAGSTRQFAVSYHIETSSDTTGSTPGSQKCISG